VALISPFDETTIEASPTHAAGARGKQAAALDDPNRFDPATVASPLQTFDNLV
jgi:hypothetical protein